MDKTTIVDARKDFFRDIGELAKFAVASDNIYKHCSTTADELKDLTLPKLTKSVKIEEIVESILNDSVSTRLYPRLTNTIY